jgi:hypothetical protein
MQIRNFLRARKIFLRIGIASYLFFFFAQAYFLPIDLVAGAAQFSSAVVHYLPFLQLSALSFKIVCVMGLLGAIAFSFGKLTRSLCAFFLLTLILLIGTSSLIRELQFEYLGFLLFGILL